jgi:hypothetical protein
MINRYGRIEEFPPEALGDRRALALRFKDLATLRADAPLFRAVEEIRWRGPGPEWPLWVARLGAPALDDQCRKALAAGGADDPAS